MSSCETLLDVPCLPCVSEVHNEILPADESNPSCEKIRDTICPALTACGCNSCDSFVEEWFFCVYECPDFACRLPSSEPTPTVPPSSIAEEVGPCYICGNPDFTVDSSKTVQIRGDTRPCVEVQVEYASAELITEFECNLLVDLVNSSCGCQEPPPDLPPTPSPPTPEAEKPSSSIAGLSALVVIPLLLVIVYLVMRRKKQDSSGPGNKKGTKSLDPPMDQYNETPPSTPARNTPPSHRHNLDPSFTESSEDDYKRPASQDAGPAGRHDSAHFAASPPGRRPGDHYLPDSKDQCRSVPRKHQLPVAVIISDDYDSDGTPVRSGDRVDF